MNDTSQNIRFKPFVLFHGNLNQFFYALLIGGFFAYAYKCGKITYTTILHEIVVYGISRIIFVSNSAMTLQTNINPVDIYNANIFRNFIHIAIEILGLTIFVNYGMILVIGFFILEILI